MQQWRTMLKLLLMIVGLTVSVISSSRAQPSGAPPSSQISYNIITDGGAACNGDVKTFTRTVRIVGGIGGSKHLSVTEETFAKGDVGKLLYVPDSNLPNRSSIIAAVIDAQNVLLASASTTIFEPKSVKITFGTDDAPAFKKFNTWARENQSSSRQVKLVVPDGANCWFGSTQSIKGFGNGYYFAGINNVVVEGTGATLNGENGAGYFLGVIGICQRGITQKLGCSARIRTASAGASQIQLTAQSLAAGYINRFSVNGWLMVGGLDTQSLWNKGYGYPPNPTYFEWRQITAIDAGTGAITLDRPLSHTYQDTWPLYSSGNAFEADQGGPATIWAIPDAWNSTAEFRGFAIKQLYQTNTIRRHVTLRNIRTASVSGAGAIPSQSESWSAYNSSFAHMEADKIVGTVLLDGGQFGILKCQSNSIDTVIIRNTTFTNQLAGCGKRTEIRDSTIAALYLGPSAYGAGTTVICTRCNVASFHYISGFGHAPQSDYAMSEGVISFHNTAASGSDPAQRIFSPMPNNLFYYVGGPFGGTIGLVRPQSITQDPTNTYVRTSEANGFPRWAGGIKGIFTHPAPQFTCDACLGDPILVAMNTQRGATPLKPLGEFSSRDFAPRAVGAQGKLVAIGKIVSLTVNVTQAYTGSGSMSLNPTGQFHQETVQQSKWAAYDWVPTINLKQAGTRIIKPSGTTCNGSPGACAGDTCSLPISGCYSLPEAVWFKDSIIPFINGTMNGGVNPKFTITIQTDQGVVP